MHSVLLDNLRYTLSMCPYPTTSYRSYGQCINDRMQCGCEYHMQSCYLNRPLLMLERQLLMARGKKPVGGFNNSVTFVRGELNAEDKKHLVTWCAKPPRPIDDMLIQVLQENHKVSYSFNATNDSFICSVTGKPDDCNNANMCYTSHAKDPIKALWVAMYKYFVIWEGKTWEHSSDEED